jgi:hypothetical protein
VPDFLRVRYLEVIPERQSFITCFVNTDAACSWGFYDKFTSKELLAILKRVGQMSILNMVHFKKSTRLAHMYCRDLSLLVLAALHYNLEVFFETRRQYVSRSCLLTANAGYWQADFSLSLLTPCVSHFLFEIS